MESIHNFRDFGGYKTQNGLLLKKGMLYRSGSLANASENDLKKLSSLGIKTICDLRTHQERNREPDRIPENSLIKAIHIPIKVTKHDESGFITRLFSLLIGKARRINYDEVLTEVYQEYIIDFRVELSTIIKLASESSYLPILIHCAGGKDRTGLSCSLIQLLLGMPLDLVMQDYLLSNDYLHEFKVEMLKRLKVFSYFGISPQKFYPLLEARKEYLEAAFNQVRNDYGTVDDYAREGLGFSDEDRLRLNQALLSRVVFS